MKLARARIGLLLCVCFALFFTDSRGSDDSDQKDEGDMKEAEQIEHKSYSAICVVARDENRYIREWVQYHQCLGIGHIYLYDHNSTVPMSKDVQDLIEEGFVTYTELSDPQVKYGRGVPTVYDKFIATAQGKGYKDCTTRYSSQHQFLGFIDVDEFIVLHERGLDNINTMLKRYKKYAGMYMYWEMLGSSGHLEPPSTWVIANYQQCVPLGNLFYPNTKAFFNTDFKPTMKNAHRAKYGVDSKYAYLVNEKKEKTSKHHAECHTVAAVYHYVTKSKADFDAKRAKGGGDGVTRPEDHLRRVDAHSTRVCTAAIDTYLRTCAAQNIKIDPSVLVPDRLATDSESRTKSDRR